MKFFGVSTVAEARKAFMGGLAPAAALIKPDLADGVLSRGEVGGLVAAFVSGAVLVFFVPNRSRVASGDASSRDRGTTAVASAGTTGRVVPAQGDVSSRPAAATGRASTDDVSRGSTTTPGGRDASPRAEGDGSQSAEADASRPDPSLY